jgi:outer membrane biosynthesis protein TonB
MLAQKIINLNINIFRINNNMNRLFLLFFALLISFLHNFYSEFNTIFLQSFFFLFLSELISVKLFNMLRRIQTKEPIQTNEDDDSTVSDNDSDSDIDEEKTEKTEEKAKDKTEEKAEEKNEDKTEEKAEDKNEEKAEDKTKEKAEDKTEEKAEDKNEDSEETEEEIDSDEPVDISEGADISQIEILRLLNNYDSLGDSGLMELKKKMLELDNLVEFYKNDTKKN